MISRLCDSQFVFVYNKVMVIDAHKTFRINIIINFIWLKLLWITTIWKPFPINDIGGGSQLQLGAQYYKQNRARSHELSISTLANLRKQHLAFISLYFNWQRSDN